MIDYKMAETDLRNMIMNFRVSDLQVLLGFAGRNKTGKKQELQSRALDLTKMKSLAVELKIKELHNRRYHHQLGSRPVNYETERALADRPIPNYDPTMNNNYATRCNPNVRPMPMNQGPNPGYSGKPYIPPMLPATQYPPFLDAKFKELPFYDTVHTLIKPFNLLTDPVERLQECTYPFSLTPQQAHDVAVSKDSSGNYECQVLLRFCLVEQGIEQDDNFPPNISVKINNKPVPLPNPIPTNRPGVEPKRPSKPVNITPFTKLSPTVTNTISIAWSSNYGRVYGAEISIARLLTSSILLQRLKSKGYRNAELTKIMIVEKLQQGQDSDIATTSLQASLICPLGKLKMELPCRANTCAHIACFDALLYIQLNEKKPKWRCPVCDKPALFRNLLIDGLFMDIISRVPSECTDVQLHDDGSWTPIMPVKEPKEVKKVVVEQAKKKPSKPVELVDISSDSEDEAWKNNKISHNSQDNESPPLVFIPQCPTPPVTAYSPVSSVMTPNYAPVPQMVEPVPVCLTSNVPSELPSSEHLNILPDVISHLENSMPSTSNSGLGPTYAPYLTNDSSAFCANTPNTFQDQSVPDNNQTSEPIKYFDFFSLLSIPESEQQKYQRDLTEKDSSTPDVISLD